MFDRAAYEATLAGCAGLTPVSWRFQRAGDTDVEDDDRESVTDRLREAAASVISWPVDAWQRRQFRRRYPDALMSRRFGRNKGWFMYAPVSDADPDREPKNATRH